MSMSTAPPPERPLVQRSAQTVGYARHVAAILLEHAETVAHEPRLAPDLEPPDVPAQLPLADVRYSVERYAVQADALARRELPTPVLFSPEGPVAPVDIGLPSLPAEQRAQFDDSYLGALVTDLLDVALSAAGQSGSVEALDGERSRELVEQRLAAFLAARVDNSGGQTGMVDSALSFAPPGYPFTVTTSTHGRQIRYSPAYFINKNLGFGSTLSTVTGYLDPGRYTFGAYSTADGSNLWDGAEYDVPHLTSSAYIGF